MNNFGVIHVLDKLVADAPQPLPRQSIERLVNTDEKNLVLLYLKSSKYGSATQRSNRLS